MGRLECGPRLDMGRRRLTLVALAARRPLVPPGSPRGCRVTQGPERDRLIAQLQWRKRNSAVTTRDSGISVQSLWFAVDGERGYSVYITG